MAQKYHFVYTVFWGIFSVASIGYCGTQYPLVRGIPPQPPFRPITLTGNGYGRYASGLSP